MSKNGPLPNRAKGILEVKDVSSEYILGRHEMGLAGNRRGHWVLSGQAQGPAKGHPEMGASGQLSHVAGSLECLKTRSVPVLDIPRDQQLGPRAACHGVSRHLASLFCLGPLEEVITGQREGRPFTITPPLAPPRGCLAFI